MKGNFIREVQIDHHHLALQMWAAEVLVISWFISDAQGRPSVWLVIKILNMSAEYRSAREVIADIITWLIYFGKSVRLKPLFVLGQL